jgi:hypothetical protein
MRNKNLSLIVLVLFLSIGWVGQGYPFTKPTHEEINGNIARRTINDFSLNNFLVNQLGLNKGIEEVLQMGTEKKTISDWISYGGIQEDNPEGIPKQIIGRARNQKHFHNPLEPWDQAGLHVFPYAWRSSIVWTQNANQSPGGQWSWHDARNYFYQG